MGTAHLHMVTNNSKGQQDAGNVKRLLNSYFGSLIGQEKTI